MSKRRPPTTKLNQRSEEPRLISDQTFDQLDMTFDQTIDEHLDEDLEATDIENQTNEGANLTPPGLLSLTSNRTGVFAELSEAVKLSLMRAGRLLTYELHDELNVVGDPCKGLSFILNGQVKVEWMDALGWEPIAQMGEGGVFGVLEWAEAKIWEERITALQRTEVLFIPTHRLHSLIVTHPDLQRQTARYTERHQLHTLLGINTIFQGVTEQDLMRLVDIATLRYASAGAKLFGPQMILALLFVIGRGEVELSIDDRVIQTLGRGELVNLEFTLGDIPQLLTATVSEDATLYVLPFDEVEEVLNHTGKLQSLQRQAHLIRARALNE